MAYWKENINVEVLLPFDTENCTVSWYWVTFSIPLEATWIPISGGVWIYNAGTYTNHRINICGRIACKSGGHIERTTCHLMACRAYSDTENPSRSNNEHFKVRLLSRDKALSCDEQRSMRLHCIDYGTHKEYRNKKQ
jgi:hypothetical protein